MTPNAVNCTDHDKPASYTWLCKIMNGLDKSLDFLEQMPLLHGIIVGVSLTLWIGVSLISNLDYIVEITNIIASIMVFVLGTFILFLVRKDRRAKDRRLWSLAVILFMAADAARMIDGYNGTFMLLHNIATVIIMFLLLVTSLHGCLRK